MAILHGHLRVIFLDGQCPSVQMPGSHRGRRTRCARNYRSDRARLWLSVRVAEDGFIALQILREVLPDIIIAHLRMPDMSGFELLSIIRRWFPHIPTIAISGEFALASMPLGLLVDHFFQSGAAVLLFGTRCKKRRVWAGFVQNSIQGTRGKAAPDFGVLLKREQGGLPSTSSVAAGQNKRGTITSHFRNPCQVLSKYIIHPISPALRWAQPWD
jgi:CheY-like chemotaxis protein